jgi:NSS family neurotransmitter:Na+ symporter
MGQARGNWTSRTGFVLAAAGSAIGLGNLWKFPYITWHNEGGAFVIVYLVAIAMVGLPIMMTEIMIGRMTQLSPVGAFKSLLGRYWGVVGGLGVVTGVVILGYYSMIAGWAIRYFLRCLSWTNGTFPVDADLPAEFTQFAANGSLQVLLAGTFMVATVMVVHCGVGRGIERLSRILLPILFSILLILLGTSLTMSGAREALGFIFTPHFDQLSMRGVLEALGHAFFTLSLGMGAMITYGSYLSRRESIVKSSFTIVILDTFIALIATVIMFSVIFSEPGLKEQISGSTVGMLFITLPKLFYTTVPMGSILAPMFYILVGFAALTSTVSLLEVMTSYFIDERGWTRGKSAIFCGSLVFFAVTVLCCLSLGAWGSASSVEIFAGKRGVFLTLDHLASNWLLPVGGFCTTLAAGWFITAEATAAELSFRTEPAWFRYPVWRFLIRYIAPLAVATIIAAVISGMDFS